MINYQNQSLTYKTTREDLINNVTTAWENLKGQWQQIKASEQNTDLAKKSYAAAEAKEKFGMIDAFTLSQQQQTLIQSENALVTAKINYLNQVYSFKQLLGSIFNEWHIHFAKAKA